MDDSFPIGPFDVGGRLGEGAMGLVYRGLHRETGVPVAIKVIRRDAGTEGRRRFHEEVQAHAGLQHPGVVYLFDYGEIGPEAAEASGDAFCAGDPYVAMQLAERGTLRAIMPFQDWEPVCRLLVQILDALAYAHARGVVHRDLKPENFLLFDTEDDSDSDWRVKLADFGIAHALREEREADTQRLEGVAGTPMYMAPEQFRGRWRRYGPWTDLYAVGCIAWELVCGRPPFTGDNFLSIAMSHEKDARPSLEPRFPVPDQLEGWIHRAMAVEPERRFRRAADAVWALPRSVIADVTDRSDLPDATSPTAETSSNPETISYPVREAAQTEVPALASTMILEDRRDVESAETVAAEEGDTREPATRASTPREILAEGQPPVPEDWRPGRTDPLPAPLVGAGLGLFGLREPPFVNRARECQRIWEALHGVIEDQTLGVVSVEGEAGTGKSRLVEWMATRVHEVGAAQVLRAVHTKAGGPNEGLRGALARSLRTLKMARGEVYEHLRDELPQLEGRDETWRERDARALTEYLRPTDDTADEVDGPRYRFSSADQKRGLLVRTLRRLSNRRPVFLWLDDLQWGDEAIGVVEELVGDRDCPAAVFVVATVRSDLLREQPTLEERIDDVVARAPAVRLSLEPLEVDDQRELLQGLLPLDDELAGRLAERTEGHPLFAMQLLAHWIDEGVLEADPNGFRVPTDRQVELPADIHQLWMDRIDRLVEQYPSGRRQAIVEALERAAALGRELDEFEWQHLCASFDAIDPEALRNRLIEAGLAETIDQGWAFAHGLLVDSLERRAEDEGRRQPHHRRCAELLEDLYPDRPKATAARRAEHWLAAGDRERALEPLLDEVERQREMGPAEKMRSVLERRQRLLDTLDISENDPRYIENDVKLAGLELAAGASPDRVSVPLADVQKRAEEAGDDRLVARAWGVTASARRRVNDQDAARKAAEKATQWARRSDSAEELVKALLMAGWVAYDNGALDAAEKRFSRALEHARDAGDRPSQLMSRRNLARVALSRGRDERATTLFESVLEESRNAGYRRNQMGCLNGLAAIARFDGDAEAARRWYRRAKKLAEELHLPGSVALYHLNLAQVELMTGRFEPARKQIHRANRRNERLETNRPDLLRLIWLAHSAGTGDWGQFEERFSRYGDGWPADGRVERDHPWLLEMAGEYASEASERERARKVWRLARELWERLGDDEAAAEVAGKLDASSGA